jgi:hypothetical protein
MKPHPALRTRQRTFASHRRARSSRPVTIQASSGEVRLDVGRGANSSTSSPLSATGASHLSYQQRRYWLGVAAGLGLPSNRVAVRRSSSVQRPGHRAAELRCWWSRAARDSNPQPPDP